jgi:pantetheine-phosphate adenylyltransferase
MTTAIVPGSFDPVTCGHLDIIERAAGLFDHVIVAVAVNSSKTPLFTMPERAEMLAEACTRLANVSVDSFDGLLVDFAAKNNARVIVRGLRAVTDFEYELQIALVNRRLGPAIETVFMMPDAEFSSLSSSIVKEIARLGGSVEGLVPESVRTRLAGKISNQKR